MARSFLEESPPRLLLFGGKGGVGKTSLAAATALALAQRRPHQRVLVVSTDPAHSLADSFEYPLGPEPRPVYNRPNLFGMEIDAQAALRGFLAKHGEALKQIFLHGTYLAEEDLPHLFDLQFPGLDEAMALLRIQQCLTRGEYGTVVVDTAPTGHTLRLLELPSIIDSWVAFLDTLLEKHRYLAQLYMGRYHPDEADALIDALSRDIAQVRALLQDPAQTEFLVVAVPEAMVMAETAKLIERLAGLQMPVRHLVLNRVIPPSSVCPFCAAKHRAQRDQLQRLPGMFPSLSVWSIPLFPHEIRGKCTLTALAAAMDSAAHLGHAALQASAQQLESIGDGAPSAASSVPPIAVAPPSPSVKLFLFGGKGGVGKTSLACAFALQLARLYPDTQSLLFSTDPAHSLADCLEQAVGEHPTTVHGWKNLDAQEIKPENLLERFKRIYADEMAMLFSAATQSAQLDVPFDRQVMTQLLDLIPPGIDEIMALIEIMASLRSEAYDFYILDNAPTGHLLRFLELPDLMQEWLRIFFRMILRYRGVVHLPKTASMLVQISRDLKAIRRQLASSEASEFIPVAIPTIMSLKETRRLLAQLDKLGIHCRRLFINQVRLSVDGCDLCTALQAEQTSVIAQFQREFPTLTITCLPWLAHELKGTETLADFIQWTRGPANP